MWWIPCTANTCTATKTMRISGKKYSLTVCCPWENLVVSFMSSKQQPLKLNDTFYGHVIPFGAARAWSPSWWLVSGQNLASSFQGPEKKSNMSPCAPLKKSSVYWSLLVKEKSPACCAWIFVNVAAGFFSCRPAAWISPWWTDSACAPLCDGKWQPTLKRICGCSLEN